MKNSFVGIVVAKENSIRFPGKNIHPYEGEPLFWHSVKPLLESKYIADVFVATNSKKILNVCNQKNVNTIWRDVNVVDDEEPLLSVLKYCYQSLSKKYDYVITIMANCPNHTTIEVNEAIKKIVDNNLNEVRGFNSNGLETGMLLFKSDIIKNGFQISSHLGMVASEGFEIHYLEELPSTIK